MPPYLDMSWHPWYANTMFNQLQFQPLKEDPFINSQARWGYYKGIYATHQFPNNYGVHVLQYDPNSQPGRSLGPMKGTYELRVLRYINDTPELAYDTPITNDVIGQLTSEQVSHYMQLVSQL